MFYLYYNSVEKNELIGKVKQLKQTFYTAIKRNGCYVPGLQYTYLNKITILEFSRLGFIHKKYLFNNGDTHTFLLYTEKGKCLTTIEYVNDNQILSRTENTYNELEHLLESITYDSENEWTNRVHCEYNEQNNCTLSESIQRNGLITNHNEQQWNEQGKVSEKKVWLDNMKKLHCWQRYQYDERGIESGYVKLNEQGEIISTIKYLYDEYGKLIGKNENGKITRYDEFEDEDDRLEIIQTDEIGNWTQAANYENQTRPTYFVIREFTYYDHISENQLLTNKNTPINMTQKIITKKEDQHITLDVEHWKWILEGSLDGEFDSRRFYTAMNKHMPSRKELFSHQTELNTLKYYLTDSLGGIEIFADLMEESDDESLYNQYVLYFPTNGYLLVATDIQHHPENIYTFMQEVESRAINYAQFGEVMILFPAPACGQVDVDFELELNDYLQLCRMEKKPEKPEIMMITASNGSFALSSYPVQDNFEIRDLDLHYGNGFEKFHSELMNRFNTQHQGLILFHGEPGTGKTYYIRHLLRKMKTLNKAVIYMPPNMVDHLVDPGFMTFITHQVKHFQTKGLRCVLLIEDAEPLLVARDADTRIQGITNLLNMTDGLLNDMLKIQIICTFNVNLKQLDKALLRPGRLTARKEFTALPAFEANILAHQLGIKHVFHHPATLSEIYAKVRDKNTLTHSEE